MPMPSRHVYTISTILPQNEKKWRARIIIQDSEQTENR